MANLLCLNLGVVNQFSIPLGPALICSYFYACLGFSESKLESEVKEATAFSESL